MNLFKKDPEAVKKKLNGRTPVWFKDWYASEFVPVQVRVSILLYVAFTILIAVIVGIVAP